MDNNPSSYWHSNYRDGQQKPYPFTFVIDMKDELMVGKLGAMSRENNYYTKGISYYISDDDEFTAGNPDGNQWTYIGEIELLKQNGMQWSEVITSTLEKQVKGRYLKIMYQWTWSIPFGGYCRNYGTKSNRNRRGRFVTNWLLNIK